MTYSQVERGFLCPRGHARYPNSNQAPDCTPECHPPEAGLDQGGGWVWVGNLSGWEVGESGVHHRCGYWEPWRDEGLWDGRYLGNLTLHLLELLTTHHCPDYRGHDCSEHGGVSG